MQQHYSQINDVSLSPSFNCYFADNVTATAAIKISRELDQFSNIHEDDFEFFSLGLSNEKSSTKQTDPEHKHFIFPVFDTALVTNDEIDHLVLQEIDDKLEDKDAGVFCFWRPKKTDFVSSNLTKCRKSNSTGTGLRKWRIKNWLKRSSSESVFFLWFKKNGTEVSKQNRKVYSEEVAGKLRTSSSHHEVFYMQKREEQKGDKMKSFLPYKQVGLFVNINNRISNKKL